jgi:hypothetical protein
MRRDGEEGARRVKRRGMWRVIGFRKTNQEKGGTHVHTNIYRPVQRKKKFISIFPTYPKFSSRTYFFLGKFSERFVLNFNVV